VAAARLDGLKGKPLLDGVVDLFLEIYGDWWLATLRWVSRIGYAIGILGALAAGEIFALLALTAQDASKAGYAKPVLAAVTGGLLGVGAAALVGTGEARSWRPGPDWQSAIAWWGVLVLLSRDETEDTAVSSPAGPAHPHPGPARRLASSGLPEWRADAAYGRTLWHWW
jgi:hypothetical protein